MIGLDVIGELARATSAAAVVRTRPQRAATARVGRSALLVVLVAEDVLVDLSGLVSTVANLL